MIHNRNGARPLSRRGFLALTASFAARSTSAGLARRYERLPITGVRDSRLKPFDELMSSFVVEHQIPGASLAVTRHGKLIYARGFGYANQEEEVPVQPSALFRRSSRCNSISRRLPDGVCGCGSDTTTNVLPSAAT